LAQFKKYLFYFNVFLFFINKYLSFLHHKIFKQMKEEKRNYVFIGLQVISWIIFIGLSIEAGGLLVNFVFSLFKPEMVSRLYQKLDLSEIFQYSEWAYYSVYSLILSIALLKAYLFYVVIRLIIKLDLMNPFTAYVATQISQISYYTLSIGLISYIARQYDKQLQKDGLNTDALGTFWADTEAFILMAAIIYVISQIFKRGIELQNENELTI
jgi:hypothetical protein